MSDDEFGGLDPTTPLNSHKRARIARSTTVKSKPARGKHAAARSPELDSEIEVVQDSAEEEELEEVEVQPRQQINKRSRHKPPSKAEAPAVNPATKRAPAKGKGRTMQTNGKSIDTYGVVHKMQVDTIEIQEDEMEDAGPGPRVAAAINQANKWTNEKDHGEGLLRAQEQIATLKQQLEDLHRLRETEPERLFKEYQIRADAQYNVQQSIISELTAQVAMKEPLSKAGHMAVLNLITREAADEEKKSLEKEVEKLKSLVGEKQKELAQKDAQIAGLNQRVKELETDLKTEIAHSAAIAKKPQVPPPSVQRSGRPGGVDDPRQTVIVQFYEDVTNLIVPSMKQTKGKFLNLDEWTLSCIYTYSDSDADEEDGTPKSLNFTLRLYHELAKGHSEPVVAEKQLVPTVNYVPLELDKESKAFVNKLAFMGMPFTFSRDQLALFLRTMYKTMGDAMNPDNAIELDDEDHSDEN